MAVEDIQEAVAMAVQAQAAAQAPQEGHEGPTGPVGALTCPLQQRIDEAHDKWGVARVHLKSGVCVLKPLGCFETPVFQNRLDGFKTESCFGTEWFQNTSSVLKHSDESECFETARVS